MHIGQLLLFGLVTVSAQDTDPPTGGSRRTFYISEVKKGKPHSRYKISRSKQCCGWTDILSFAAADAPQPGTTEYFVSQVHDPDHTFRITTERPCCGWTLDFSFHAFANVRPGTDRVRALEMLDKTRMKYKLGTKAPCCGWVESTSFYTHELRSIATGPQTDLGPNHAGNRNLPPSPKVQQDRWKEVMSRPWKPGNPPKLVAIRGMYCSGTNWLRQLFNLNCPGLDFKLVSDNAGFELDADGLYGWKHGMFTPDEVETLRQHPEHILVVITKDAFSWAESFWASRTESFEGAPSVSAGYRVLRKNLASTKDTVPASDRNSFERFATMPFATRAGRNAQPRSLDFYNVPTNWTLEADNVIRAREKWAKNIFGAIDQLDNAFHIRYEDLLSDPRKTIGRVSSLANLNCPGVASDDVFVLKEGMTKFGETDERKGAKKKYSNAQRFYTTSAYLKAYTPSARQTVWDSIDRDFERDVMGYSYTHLEPKPTPQPTTPATRFASNTRRAQVQA